MSGKNWGKHCSVPGCERSIRAKGYCVVHYERLKDKGDVMADVPIRGKRPNRDTRKYMSSKPFSREWNIRLTMD